MRRCLETRFTANDWGVALVPEDIEDAGRCGDRASSHRLLDPLAKLFLREELPEGALPGHDPVAWK